MLNSCQAVLILFLAPCVTACTQPCPNQLIPSQILAASFKTEAPSAETWSSQIDLLPTNSNGEFWRGAVTDASMAPSSLGVMQVDEPSPTANVMLLGVPFPLSKGMSMPLIVNDQKGASMVFQMLPAAMGATIWLRDCPGQSPCPAANESVTGTLTVEEVAPLSLRLDATVTLSGTKTELHGALTFDIQPQGTRCSSYN